MADMSHYLDKAFEQMDFAELANAPIDALEGVSKADAEAIRSALHIKTIRDLAENKFVRRAQAIAYLADTAPKVAAPVDARASRGADQTAH